MLHIVLVLVLDLRLQFQTTNSTMNSGAVLSDKCILSDNHFVILSNNDQDFVVNLDTVFANVIVELGKELSGDFSNPIQITSRSRAWGMLNMINNAVQQWKNLTPYQSR